MQLFLSHFGMCFVLFVYWLVCVVVGYFMVEWLSRQGVPVKLRMCPWWTVWSMIAAAMFVSPSIVPQRENSRFEV